MSSLTTKQIEAHYIMAISLGNQALECLCAIALGCGTIRTARVECYDLDGKMVLSLDVDDIDFVRDLARAECAQVLAAAARQ